MKKPSWEREFDRFVASLARPSGGATVVSRQQAQRVSDILHTRQRFRDQWEHMTPDQSGHFWVWS